MNIGRNWGTPMTQKDEPELVTSGPYHLVRHPIYSAKVEEHYLTEQFPDAYPVYKRSTKMLVPLIL